MASNDSNRRWLLSAGGILSIVAGIFQINNAGVLMAVFLTAGHMPYDLELWPFTFLPGLWPGVWFIYDDYVWQIILGGSFVVLGILAVVGGISAIRRKKFGLSLTGAICALASGLLGILAVILVALGKKEFGAERKQNGI